MRYVPTNNASTLRNVPGVHIELWELFDTMPVGHQMKQDGSVESKSRTVCKTSVVRATANTLTSFTPRIQTLLRLHTTRSARLFIGPVRTAVDDARAQSGLPLSFTYRAFSFVGFISESGLPQTRAHVFSKMAYQRRVLHITMYFRSLPFWACSFRPPKLALFALRR